MAGPANVKRLREKGLQSSAKFFVRMGFLRFMILVKANKDSEAGVMPSTELLTVVGILAICGMIALATASALSDSNSCTRSSAFRSIARVASI